MTAGEEGPQGIALSRATNDVKTALTPTPFSMRTYIIIRLHTQAHGLGYTSPPWHDAYILNG